MNDGLDTLIRETQRKHSLAWASNGDWGRTGQKRSAWRCRCGRSINAPMPVDETQTFTHHERTEIANAVRAFLSLPPSEAEIRAGALAISESVNAFRSFSELAKDALVASRAVLVPPPEDAR